MKNRYQAAFERAQIRAELHVIKRFVDTAALQQTHTPELRRAQTLKIKVAARRLARLHTAIILGKGRG